MSSAQIAACVALKHKYQIVIWGGDKARGGDYQNPKYWDPMHFALKPGTSIAQVEAVIKALGIRPDGTVAPVFKPVIPAFPGKFGVGAKGDHVKAIQKGLSLTPSGVFDPATVVAVKKYQRFHVSLWPADGVVGPKTYKMLARAI
jgi:murein L,D-transpeptidase YcbB/YkuD